MSLLVLVQYQGDVSHASPEAADSSGVSGSFIYDSRHSGPAISLGDKTPVGLSSFLHEVPISPQQSVAIPSYTNTDRFQQPIPDFTYTSAPPLYTS